MEPPAPPAERLAEATDRLGDARWRAALEALHDGIIVHDLERVVSANAAATELTGIPREAMDDLDSWASLDPRHPDGTPLSLAERAPVVALRSGSPVRDQLSRITHPVRGERWLLSTAAPMRLDDAVVGAVLSFTDVTEQREAEAALQTSRARYRRLVEHAPLGYLVTDALGRIVEANRAMQGLFGLPASLLIGQQVLDWVHPDDLHTLRAQIERLWRGEQERYEVEHRVRTFGGTERWIRVACTLDRSAPEDEPTYLVLLQDVTERRQLEQRLTHQATHDGLTALPNRDHLLEHLEQVLDRVAVLFLDLDRFKAVNDTFGHDAGDDLLREVAHRISGVLRPEDVVARLGGDEFVVLCPGIGHEQPARALAERIVSAIEARPIRLGTTEVAVTASVGIALSAGVGHPEALLRDADAAMYRAKELGRARLEVFDESMRAQGARRVALAEQLARGLERGELVVHYQPVVDLGSGRVTGVEALARWQHPELGLLHPKEFIGLAEETGLIIGLGLTALTAACTEAKAWHDELGTDAPDVHVNLSARQLATPNVARLVAEVLERTGLPPERLCLEITESVLMEDAAASAAALRSLAELGATLAIDDFGTGYSSLSYLRRFPVHVLKVDGSFVDGLGPDPEDSAIVAAIVSLARTLELRAVAEGVETDDQLAELRALGCDAAQGFLFARPQPADQVRELLTRRWPA